MKDAADAILRSEQAGFLDALLPKRDALMARLESQAAHRRHPISDPEVAAVLTVVVRARAPRFLVELGTNIGYGAIALARAAGEGTRLLTVEYRAELCEEARANIEEAGLSHRVEVRQGLALQELERVDEPIDLLYLDCVKEEYPRYLELAVPRLAPRGVLLADNVLWKGLVARDSVPESERERVQALRAFDLALAQHPQLDAVILPLGDGVAFAVKRA